VLVVNVPGVAGAALTAIAIVLAVPAPQEFDGVTLKLPAVADALKLTCTLLPLPVIVAPVPE
jgi:hypothetical protein